MAEEKERERGEIGDPFRDRILRVVFFVDASSPSRDGVIAGLRTIEEDLRKDGYEILRFEIEEPISHEDQFTSLAEVELRLNLIEAVRAAARLGAGSLDILEPEKLRLSRNEFARLLGEISRISRLFGEKLSARLILRGEPKDVRTIDEERAERLIEAGGMVRAMLVFEGQGKSEEYLVKAVLTMLDDQGVRVIKHAVKPSKQGDLFEGFVGVTCVGKPDSLARACLVGAPSGITILEPEEIVLEAGVIQDILASISDYSQALVHGILGGTARES